MRKLLLMMGLAAVTWGLVGCGGSDEPKKDASGKVQKAPEVPPAGP